MSHRWEAADSFDVDAPSVPTRMACEWLEDAGFWVGEDMSVATLHQRYQCSLFAEAILARGYYVDVAGRIALWHYPPADWYEYKDPCRVAYLSLAGVRALFRENAPFRDMTYTLLQLHKAEFHAWLHLLLQKLSLVPSVYEPQGTDYVRC